MVSVLAHVLPVLREVRAPLVGGYLWLFALWIAFADAVPRKAEIAQGSVWANLHRLADAVGPAGQVAAVSVVAYLIGSLVDEVIRLLVRRPHELADQLLEVGEAVPESSRLAEEGLRLLAEANLRTHVAVPLTAAAVAFAAHRAWIAGAVAAAAAGAMGVHALRLDARAELQKDVVTSLVRNRQALLSAEEMRQQSARVEVRVVRDLTTMGAVNYQLRFRNVGNGAAHRVTVEGDEGADLRMVPSGALPITELPPGEEVDIPLAVSMGDPSEVGVVVRWVDRAGEHEDRRVLRVL